jgi:peptidoglycan hydrolase-like protein with peptidoglycan-binding domain
MADEMVLEVQKWVNQTYGSVTGYVKCAEDGITGWGTIYSLRMGLQHEGGISPVQEGFGDATRAVAYEVAQKLKIGYKDNTVKLIKGAFWCKGISPTDFTDEYTQDTINAIKELQTDAGVNADGFPNIDLFAALFDMSAFVLVPGGDSRIREMQQWLNANYEDYIGIRPCDGIYQRDTNEALIYALQAIGGMALGTANGFYGPGTISLTPTFDVDNTTDNKWATVLKYALYVNGYAPSDWSNRYDTSTGSLVVSFRRFMKLPPYKTEVDLTVLKGLLTSNGNTNRSTNAFDTASQLTTSAKITPLVNAGYTIVGRYLTGTVGTAHADKSLSVAELKLLTDSGLSVFPIYEDGGYEVQYFNDKQGYADGYTASNAARKLGFPSGSIIYFAADVDLTGSQITSDLIPYLSAVKSVLDNTGYVVGLYATRNACLQAESIGVNNFFVANMSSGWSGNLGFKMPSSWCFDQYNEDTNLNIDLDGYSGRDSGLSSYTEPKISPEDALPELVPYLDAKLEAEILIAQNEYLKLTFKASSTFSAEGSSHFITLKGDGVEASLKGLLTGLGMSTGDADTTINQMGTLNLLTKVKDGRLTFSFSVNSTGTTVVTLSVTVWETDKGKLNSNLVLAYKLTLDTQKYLSDGLKLTSTEISVMGVAALIVLIAPALVTAIAAIPSILAGGLTATAAAALIMTNINSN